MLANTIPSDIKRLSYEFCMAAIRIEIHLVKFNSHPTGTVRYCLKCDEEIDNKLHTFFHCPVATFMWDIFRDIIKLLLGVRITFNMRTT